MTWRGGIPFNLHKMGMRGLLPKYLSSFLLRSPLSNKYLNENSYFFFNSMSVHATLSNSRTELPVVRKLLHKFYNCKLLGKGVELCWVPSHVGIFFCNERADKLASDAAKQLESLVPSVHNDFSTAQDLP